MAPFVQIRKKLKKLAGWRKFAHKVRPTHHFDFSSAPDAPDYSKLSNWAAHPELDSKVYYTPEGLAGNNAWKEGSVDVFFIYPTLYFGKDFWNASLDHAATNELVGEMIMTGQASVFNSCCRIFSPRYRQATFASFLGAGRNGRQALELAYSDCLEAFDYYLKNFNEGRPFFLAGHSQGALHTMRLLEDRIEGTELSKKLVAAYPIGFWFPMDKFGDTLTDIQPAKNSEDLQSVIAYDTYLDGGGPLRFLDRAEVVYGGKGNVKWKKRSRKKPLGVNPLSWSPHLNWVEEKRHLGAVHLSLKQEKRFNWDSLIAGEKAGIQCIGLSKPCIGECSARLGKDGILYVTSPKNRVFKNMLLPGGNLHMSDYALFYMNLRENILSRWKAFSGQERLT